MILTLKITKYLCETTKILKRFLHAPHSTDFALSEFWLFAILKNALCGQSLSRRSAAASVVYQWDEHKHPKILRLFLNHGDDYVKYVMLKRRQWSSSKRKTYFNSVLYTCS